MTDPKRDPHLLLTLNLKAFEMRSCLNFVRLHTKQLASALCGVALLCTNTPATAQEAWRPAIVSSLQNPPSFFKPSGNWESLEIIEWQLTQNKRMLQAYGKELELIEAKEESLAEHVAEVSNTVPLDFRFLNAEARSAYVARLVSLTLDLRLEMATHEVMLENLKKAESEPTQADKKLEAIQQDQLQLKFTAAELQVENALREVELSRKILERVITFENEKNVVQKSNELAIAKTQLSNVKLQFKLAKESTNAQRAKAVGDHRLALAPLSAKLKIASKTLEEYRGSASKFDRIESFRREQQALHIQSDRFTEAIGKIKRETLELNMLKRLISEHQKTNVEATKESTSPEEKE